MRLAHPPHEVAGQGDEDGAVAAGCLVRPVDDVESPSGRQHERLAGAEFEQIARDMDLLDAVEDDDQRRFVDRHVADRLHRAGVIRRQLGDRRPGIRAGGLDAFGILQAPDDAPAQVGGQGSERGAEMGGGWSGHGEARNGGGWVFRS